MTPRHNEKDCYLEYNLCRLCCALEYFPCLFTTATSMMFDNEGSALNK